MAAKARLDQGEMSRLIEAGAFKSLSGNRYQSHWQATGIIPRPPLLEVSLVTERQDHINLKAPPEAADLRADYERLGLRLGRHPMAIPSEQETQLKYSKKASELDLIKQYFISKVMIDSISTPFKHQQNKIFIKGSLV